MGSIPVVSLDAEHNLIDRILLRVPNSALDHVAGEDVEPDFDLIVPRGVHWGEIEGQSSSS